MRSQIPGQHIEKDFEIRRANLTDLATLVPLFEAYGQFYRQPSNIEKVLQFILERLTKGDSTILVSVLDSDCVGFAQLYPSFTTVALGSILILNDLFVTPNRRRTGAGSALLRYAEAYAREVGAVQLVLSTEIGNAAAQSLYERHGWERDRSFYVYKLVL